MSLNRRALFPHTIISAERGWQLAPKVALLKLLCPSHICVRGKPILYPPGKTREDSLAPSHAPVKKGRREWRRRRAGRLRLSPEAVSTYQGAPLASLKETRSHPEIHPFWRKTKTT